MLLLLASLAIPEKEGVELQQIFNFISVATQTSDAKEAIVLDYTYANYVFTINIFPDELNLKKLDSKIDDVKLDDYLLFTKGTAAGKVAKIENLLFHKNHLRKTNIKIVPVTNTILVRKIESDSIAEGFHDLIIYSLFFKDLLSDSVVNNAEIYFENTFINNLCEKNEKNEIKQAQFSLSIKDFKHVKINLPHKEIQRDLIKRFENEHNNVQKLPNSIILFEVIKDTQFYIYHNLNQ